MSGDKLWELSDPAWRCPECHASAAEVRSTGHRHQGGRACPEACTCLPEHRSLQEHRLELAANDLAHVLK